MHRSLAVLAALSLVLVLLSGTALQAQAVVVYQNSGYSGTSYGAPLIGPQENLILPLGINDQTTSIAWSSLPANVILIFFENADGTGREYTVMHDQPRSGGISNVGSYYNDKFSSWKWRTVDPSKGWVRMYTDTSFGGYHLTRYLSQIGVPGGFSIKDEGYNDQVDSAQWSIPKNQTAMLLDEDPPGGKAFALHGNGAHSDFDNGESGIYHDIFSSLLTFHGEIGPDFANRNAPMDTISQLMSHNAAVSSAHGFYYYNQTKHVTWQLDYGARGLMLDTLKHTNNVLYSVHGSYSETETARLGSTPETLLQVLNPIKGWLDAHPNEVITLIFEHQGGTELGDYLLNASPIKDLIYTEKLARRPSINQLVTLGKRVVIFQQREGEHDVIPWQWDVCVENEYDSFGSTTARSESDPINNRNRSLFVMNHIDGSSLLVTNPNNSFASLSTLANQFTQIPNFVNIDGIEGDDHGGLETARWLNQNKWANRDTPSHQPEFHRFGDPCSYTLSVIGAPRIGSTLQISSSTALDAVAWGFSDSNWAGTPLPLDLSLISASTCQLYISAEAIDFHVPATSTISLTIPKWASLPGFNLFVQGGRINGGAYRVTEAARIRIGGL